MFCWINFDKIRVKYYGLIKPREATDFQINRFIYMHID